MLTLGFLAFTEIYLESTVSLFQILETRFYAKQIWHDFLIAEGIAILAGLAVIAIILFEKHRPARKALGNAHFANGYEARKAGFLQQDEAGIILGKKYGVPLYSNGFEHVLLFAPTGSGKTRSIGIPNLFNYPYSIVCNDVKLSMFKTTSGYREKVLGHKCYCFAPASEDRTTHLSIST